VKKQTDTFLLGSSGPSSVSTLGLLLDCVQTSQPSSSWGQIQRDSRNSGS